MQRERIAPRVDRRKVRLAGAPDRTVTDANTAKPADPVEETVEPVKPAKKAKKAPAKEAEQ